MGKAYGFFDCRASKEEIEAELPRIRELSKTPSELELSLIEDMDNLKGDEELMSIARDATYQGIRWVLETMYPGVTNKEAADETVSILNQAYQTPLYEDEESFRGAVVYKEKDRYTFME